jgi:hypothetical protein
MQQDFADWHRDAGIEPNAETSPKHWSAIDEYRPKAEEIISFSRFFYGFLKQGEAPLNEFAAAVVSADPTFSIRDDKQLLVVLVGSELVRVIERNDDEQLADLAALCLVSGAAQGVRAAPPIAAMPKIAARYIERRTSKRASLNVEENKDVVGTQIQKLEREVAIVGEETNMLWWLVSQFSRDLSESWEKVGLRATSILAGKELADLTRVIPGPVAAAAFLDRIVHLCDSAKSQKQIKVKDSIEKTPREWRERNCLKSLPEGLEDLVPVNNGITLSLKVSEGDDWSSVFENGTSMPTDSKMLPHVLAYQVFLERLLARLLGQIQ